MRRGVPAFVLAAATLWTSGAGAAPPATKTVPDEPYPDAFKARVNAEIERGAKKLLTKLERGELRVGSAQYDVGQRALVLLTLLKCGVPKENPAVAAEFAALRASPPKQTYDVGVLLMAVAARYDGPFDAFATDIVDAAGRHVVPPPTTDTLESEDRASLAAGVAFLVERQSAWKDPRGDARRPDPDPPPKARKPARPTGKTAPPEAPEPPKGWGYPGGATEKARGDWIDVSNIQYALLGLKAAARCGLPVPAATWSAALSLLLEWQAPEGVGLDWRGNEVRGANRIEWKEPAQARGFGYTAPARSGAVVSGGRTAAGAVGMMICQSELWNSPKFSGSVEARTRSAVRDALAWMQANFRPDRNPAEGAGLLLGKDLPDELRHIDPYYTSYLYATERMGVLAHARFLGEHDWYLEGAEAVLARRATGDSPMLDRDDCFELLFLKRASFRTSVPVITPDPGPAMDDPGMDPAPGTSPGK